MSTPEPTEPQGRSHEFPCEQCGAQVQYAPGTRHLRCPYCNHEQDIPEAPKVEIRESDYLATLADVEGRNETTVTLTVKCEACAAEFTFDPNVEADDCPYCGAHIVVDEHETRVIRPRALLPFEVTSEQASTGFRKWLGGLWFAPNKLKRYARRDRKLNGMYMPYWTYDSDTRSRYRGQRGTYYQEAVKVRVQVDGRWTTKTQTVTKIRWTPVSGTVARHFDDLSVCASGSVPRNIARELEPWDLENLQPFQEHYLSGFRAEVYQTDLKEGFGIARQRMHEVILQDVARDIGGDQQRIQDVDTRYDDISFKHILLPLWTAGFRFRGKTYQFVINGRTGEVQGERPYSAIKIALAVLAAVAVIVAIAYFYAGGQVSVSY